MLHHYFLVTMENSLAVPWNIKHTIAILGQALRHRDPHLAGDCGFEPQLLPANVPGRQRLTSKAADPHGAGASPAGAPGSRLGPALAVAASADLTGKISVTLPFKQILKIIL